MRYIQQNDEPKRMQWVPWISGSWMWIVQVPVQHPSHYTTLAPWDTRRASCLRRLICAFEGLIASANMSTSLGIQRKALHQGDYLCCWFNGTRPWTVLLSLLSIPVLHNIPMSSASGRGNFLQSSPFAAIQVIFTQNPLKNKPFLSFPMKGIQTLLYHVWQKLSGIPWCWYIVHNTPLSERNEKIKFCI